MPPAAGRTSSGISWILALALAAAALSTSPAAAQIDVLSPAFRDLNGGIVWGSVGGNAGAGATGSEGVSWRGGFAAFYGPFGGKGDTVVVFTRTVSDSVDTLLWDPSVDSLRVVRRQISSSSQYRSESKLIGTGGRVALAVGYLHSPAFQLDAPPLPSTVAMGGLFLGAFFGPYDVYKPWRQLKWYLGAAATVSQLRDIAVRADTLALEMSSERTIAPEAFLMLGYIVAPNYRILVAASYQVVRFNSLRYEAVESARLIPPETLATLPSQLDLDHVYITLGVSFSASSLFASH